MDAKAIPEGYEIIGMYGEEKQGVILSLGLLLWKPNPFAKAWYTHFELKLS